MSKTLCYNGVPLENGHRRAGEELLARFAPHKLADVPTETLAAVCDELSGVIGARESHDDVLSQTPGLAGSATLTPECRIELGEVLSPSQASGFVDCSARWYFRYALELPEYLGAKQALGKSVHRAVELNFRQKVETHEDLPDGQIIDAFRDTWEAQVGETVFHGKESPVALGKKGEAMVAMYMAEAAPSIQPAQTELLVTGEIAGVKVRGFVDILDVEGRIIDLKTVAAKPRGVASSHRFQIATYRQIAPGASGSARVDNLVKTKVPKLVRQDFDVNGGDLMITATMYPLVQAGIRSGLYWPNRGGAFCSKRACSFWQVCESEYGGTVPGEIEFDL